MGDESRAKEAQPSLQGEGGLIIGEAEGDGGGVGGPVRSAPWTETDNEGGCGQDIQNVEVRRLRGKGR